MKRFNRQKGEKIHVCINPPVRISKTVSGIDLNAAYRRCRYRFDCISANCCRDVRTMAHFHPSTATNRHTLNWASMCNFPKTQSIRSGQKRGSHASTRLAAVAGSTRTAIQLNSVIGSRTLIIALVNIRSAVAPFTRVVSVVNREPIIKVA